MVPSTCRLAFVELKISCSCSCSCSCSNSKLVLEVVALEVGAIHLSFEGDARRQVTRAVPRCLQPLQGWLTFVGPVPVAARGLATGYFLPALRAESHKSPPVIRGACAGTFRWLAPVTQMFFTPHRHQLTRMEQKTSADIKFLCRYSCAFVFIRGSVFCFSPRMENTTKNLNRTSAMIRVPQGHSDFRF